MTTPEKGRKPRNRKSTVLTSVSTPAMILPVMLPCDDPISSRILNLQQRMESCHSIYRLNMQAQALRDKERREKMNTLQSNVSDLEIRANDIESKVKTIDKLVRQIIYKQKARLNPDTKLQISKQTQTDARKFQETMTSGFAINTSLYVRMEEEIDDIDDPALNHLKHRISQLRVRSAERQALVHPVDTL